MKKLIRSAGRRAIAALLGLVVSSAAWGQQPVLEPSYGLPPVREIGPAQEYLGQPNAQPSSNVARLQTQPSPLSSQPPPFMEYPNSGVMTNDPNFFNGFPQAQDMSAYLPGNFENTKYKWYGFVRLDAIYDCRPMKSTDMFVTSAIPVPQGDGHNTVLTPRYTRLGFDTETPLDNGWDVKTRIEMDFFNGNTSGAFGSFPLRLRFAWVDFGPFLIGQAASLFMDYDVFPNVLDYEGPGGMVLVRQPIAAVRLLDGHRIKLIAGVEQPYSDIQWDEGAGWVVNPGTGIVTTPGVGRNIQKLPDFTANIRYNGDYGHLQLSGVAQQLAFRPTGGDTLQEIAGGINLTGTFHPWACLSGTPKSGDCATPMSKSRFLGQYATGDGINRYIQDVNGLGLDATFDPVNGFRTINAHGWFIAYEQWWAQYWASNFTYGENTSHLTDTLPDNTYRAANYVSANLVWFPVDRMGVGIEYLYGIRENKDGQQGDNSRIQAGFRYKF